MADVPFVLAGIEPLSLLGSGGFGEVWLALQANIDRKVAVKVGHTPIDDKTVQLRFERECIALGRLSGHPNIIDVFTAGQLDDGRPYLVLEYVSGGTLWQRSQKGPLTEAELLKVGIELADALHVAHTAGVLHRDLKPENVLLRSNGEAVLGDFGIARLHDGAHTSSHAITASVAYAAPEILSGMASSTASDLYGIGICLLTGGLRSVPFVEKADESVHPIINRVLSERPQDLSTLGFSPEMAALINTLLEKDPAKRPLSAEMVKQQLIELTLDGTSTSAAGQGADPTRPVAPPAASSGSQGPLGLPSIPTGTGPVNRGWGGGDGPVISLPYVTSSSNETAALRPRTGWDRLRLFGAAFGATLLVGGLLIFALRRLGDDDDSASTSTSRSGSTTLPETTTTEEVVALRSGPRRDPARPGDGDHVGSRPRQS